MAMSAKKRRENTFRIDYANVPKKPTSEEVHHFVGVTLGMKHDEVMRIQYSRNLGVAFVKASTIEVAQKVVEKNDNIHEIKLDGKSYKLRLLMEDGAVELKLFNLSEDVTNEKILRFLKTYGETLSIREEVWDDKHFFRGLPTGVRIVRMTVKTNIPSYVIIDGEKTLVSYYGQQQTCRHCSESIHNGVSCVQNKKLLVQKLAANSGSYADVTKNPKPPRSMPFATRWNDEKQPQTQRLTPIDTEPCRRDEIPSSVDSVRYTDESNNPAISANVQQTEDEQDKWVKVQRKTEAIHSKTNGNETDSSTCNGPSTRSSRKRDVSETKTHRTITASTN